VWLSLDEGSAAVWNVAEQFDRTRVADLTFSWSDQWSFFNVLPFFALLMLVLSIADQTVVQRLIAAGGTRHCRRSYVLGTGLLALLLAALAYAGIGLFAFYHQHPNDLRPVWVVNLDNQTRQSLTFADRDRLLAEQADVDGEGDRPRPAVEPRGGADRGEPLVDWTANLNDFDTLQRLVNERRILRPNNKQPFEAVDELLNLETDELIVDRLAMKKPDGELVLHARAGLELLPHFLSQRLGMGLLGLVLAGILAASMASFDSGVHSLATVLLVDFHRRGGIGRSLLARRLGKSPDQLTETDELKLARPLTAVAGLLAVILGLTLGQGLSAVWVLHAATLIIGTPLLTVFLLGILTRRTTGAGVLAGMVVGALLIGWLVFSPAATQGGGGSAAAWPRGGLSASWVMILGAAATALISLVVSLFAGSRRSRQELRGLVVGIGQLGEREIVHESISIPGGEDTPGKDSRWRD
jgi:Na+/proline symporter